MALTTTTLSSAVAVNDTSIVVASASGFAAGSMVLCDQEVMKVTQGYSTGTTIPVLRGQDGTATAAHKVTANVTVGVAASDFSNPVAQTEAVNVTQRPRTLTSYSAAGAITLPAPGSDAVAVLNGTSILAMTLANPTKDMDGAMLVVLGNGKAAHTLTYTAGFGNKGAGATVGTFSTTQAQSIVLFACNGFWVTPGIVSGAATVAGVGVA